MEHIFKPGKNQKGPTLLLLHGTGGNERDLLPLAEMIAPEYPVLGVRGNISENGMNRFFRRLSEGVFDEEDLVYRTKELKEFIDECAERYDFDRSQVIAIGYSNGANIAASMMYHYKDAVRGAVLFHAMVPIRGSKMADLTGTPVFIAAGENDPLIPAKETKELINDLTKANADVTEFWTRGGHQLTREEVVKAADWFKEKM
ncbi:alpha/beta hydrolase [Bacillus sp. AK031]